MKKIILILTAVIIVLSASSCLTVAVPAPTVLEDVSWNELADQSAIEANDNRYVTVEVQFLGLDAAAMPAQMLYTPIQPYVLMNHTEIGASYDEEVITSLDSFIVGLLPGDKTDDLMTNGVFGDTIKITGTTEYVNAGFGSFQHLLVKVEDFENLGQ